MNQRASGLDSGRDVEKMPLPRCLVCRGGYGVSENSSGLGGQCHWLQAVTPDGLL